MPSALLEGVKSWHDDMLEHTTSDGPYNIREIVGGHGFLLDVGPDVCLRSHLDLQEKIGR